jgi:8-oxo-dGTP pyrophosphatase MutT (NUDIX family)
VSPTQPDIVEVWVFRDRTTGLPPALGSERGPTAHGQPDRFGRSAGAAAPGIEAPASGVTSDEASAGDGPIEILLLRRGEGDILPGLWQSVSGGVEPDEAAAAAALRELAEETGFGPRQIAAFYHLDQVNQFHEPSVGGIVSSVVFAARVVAGAEPMVSAEHDSMRWVSPDEALGIVVWPAHRESIRRIVENLLDPERAPWFELKLSGERARR